MAKIITKPLFDGKFRLDLVELELKNWPSVEHQICLCPDCVEKDEYELVLELNVTLSAKELTELLALEARQFAMSNWEDKYMLKVERCKADGEL
jgi:hypothetical protein